MRVQKQTKRVLYWGITLVLMILIFSFSAKNGTSSAGMSIGYAKELARILSFLGFFQIHSNADLMIMQKRCIRLLENSTFYGICSTWILYV